MNVSSVIKPVLLASLCGLAIGSIYFYSKDRIQFNRFEYETRQLKEVAGLDDVEIMKAAEDLYEIWRHQVMLGHIHGIETDQGYNGRISAWLAMDSRGSVLGVRIKRHRETPGLGDKIDRRVSSWVDQFIGHSLKSLPVSKWRIIKDGGKFDQFTGATVTPRAVVNMVRDKLVSIEDLE